MGYNTINFKSKDILYAHQLNIMDGQISTNDKKVLYLDSEIKKVATQILNIPSWAKEPSKPTYTATEVGTYSSEEIDDKLLKITGVDLSNYYTKQEIDKKIPTDYITSDVLNNYVPLSTLSDYVTLQDLGSMNYVTISILNSKDYANKTYVRDQINNVVFNGVDLSEYLTVEDAEYLVTSFLANYASTKYLEENYYNKEEVENLVLGGSLSQEITAREEGDAYLQNQIDNLKIPSEKTYTQGLILDESSNTVSLSLANDDNTQANLQINENGALQFIGQQEEFLEIVSKYTINGFIISSNPTLGGGNIKLKDYNEGMLINSDDTINDAFLKIENQITWGTI